MFRHRTFARRVFPQPGGPASRTPAELVKPKAEKRSGCRTGALKKRDDKNERKCLSSFLYQNRHCEFFSDLIQSADIGPRDVRNSSKSFSLCRRLNQRQSNLENQIEEREKKIHLTVSPTSKSSIVTNNL